MYLPWDKTGGICQSSWRSKTVFGTSFSGWIKFLGKLPEQHGMYFFNNLNMYIFILIINLFEKDKERQTQNIMTKLKKQDSPILLYIPLNFYE